MSRGYWIIDAMAAIASAIILGLWYAQGLDQVDFPVDLIVAIVWWVIIVAAVALVTRAESRRRAALRTIYVGPDGIFNPEKGQVRCTGLNQQVQQMQGVLSELSYRTGKHSEPDAKTFDCRYIVRTSEFKDGDASAWRGSVVRAGEQKGTEFRGLDQLKALLAA